MKIRIIGGGIGGLTTAIALQQHGFEAHVYEAAPEIRPIGKGIWLPTNAMLVMERLGLADRLVTQGVELDRIELRDKTAGVLQAIDLIAVKRRFGRTTTSILRSDLQATLAAALQDGTLHLNKRCVAVRHGDNHATVTFEDGSDLHADLVVGADGIRSQVRESVQPNVPLRYSGQTCFLGVADMPLPSNSLRIVQEIWGGRARFGYSAVGKDRVYWYAPISAEAGQPLPEDVLTVLRNAYADFPDPVREIVDATSAENIIKVDLRDFAPIRRWYQNRVVLIGDAAHAMTPNLGQGGAQAIEDAYALAHMLRGHATVDAALDVYQSLRQPKARRTVNLAWRMGQLAHLTAPVARRARNAIFQLTPKSLNQRQVEQLYGLNF